MNRIGIIQIWQESNSFNPVPTTWAQFQRWGLVEGEEVLTRFGDAEEIGGFVSGLRERADSPEPVGLLRAVCWPGGPLSKEAMRRFEDAVRERVSHAGALDGLLFSLHGALVAKDEPDADGRLLGAARDTLGDGVPIVATLDCHAYVTRRMLRSAEVLVAYHTCPHVDRFQTGQRAACALAKVMEGASAVSASVRLPMITSGEVTNTVVEPLSAIFQRLGELERREDVLSAAVLMTQPWLDVPELGWSTLVTSDGAGQLAGELAEELAKMCQSSREKLRTGSMGLRGADQAIAEALACDGKPVIIADGADATNSGAPGDSTHLLRAMIEKEIPDGALTIMVAPHAVAHAKSVGPGAAFDFAIGGKRDSVFSQPLPVEGKVISVGPARYVLSGHAADRLPVDMGLAAVLRIGDVTLLAVEYSGPGSTPEMYRCVGLEPRDFKIVIVKSPAGFRADFAPFAAHIILTDCPGCASPHFKDLPYTKITRPLWPLDEITDRCDASWASEMRIG